MKKNTFLPFLISLIILSSTSSYAQNIYRVVKTDPVVNSFTSVDEARDMISNIISVVGLKPKFDVREANIPNAAAVIYGSKRFILYNPNFVTTLNKAAGNKWASVSILAHEIGHHLNGHTLENGGSKPAIELEADEFSGFVLRKMGATLQEAQVAMKIAASQRASHTHPAQADRLFAIAKGWNAASNQVNGTANDVAKIYKRPETEQPVVKQLPKIESPVVRTQQTALADKYIFKDVHFYNDKYSNYYVTIRSHLVKVDGDRLTVLGKLISSDNAKYPIVIVDEQKNYWFINPKGRIVSKDGKEIGYISNHS